MNPATLGVALSAWKPADDAERSAVDLLVAHLDARSGSRTHFAPGHITASGLVFSKDGSRVALVWHADFERWIQPGGHLEPGEEPIDAVLRELEEEIGATDLLPHGLVDVTVYDVPENQRRNEPKHQHFDLRYAFTVDGPLASRRGVRWLLLAEVTEAEADAGVVRGLTRWRNR